MNGALPLCCSVFLPLSVIRMSPCWGRVSHIRDLSTCSWLGIETDVRMMHHQLRIRCNPVRMGEVYTGSTLPGYCIKYDVLMCVRALLCMCVRTIYRLWTSCVLSLAGVERSTSPVGIELDRRVRMPAWDCGWRNLRAYPSLYQLLRSEGVRFNVIQLRKQNTKKKKKHFKPMVSCWTNEWLAVNVFKHI